MFQPHGIINILPIDLGGKVVSMVVEVIEEHLEYNMLLRCTWFYNIIAIFSLVFKFLRFPNQGKIIR
jgi:hypothetical protein